MQSIPVQSWTFEQESVIRIGRSTDNHVILYSAVVSRHHVEIRKGTDGWEIVNLGANGTYLDGKRITTMPVEDGVIIRLARSGPNVQIHLGAKGADAAQGVGEKTIGQRLRSAQQVVPPPSTNIPATDISEPDEANVNLGREGNGHKSTEAPSPPVATVDKAAPPDTPDRVTHLQEEDDHAAEGNSAAEAAQAAIALAPCCQQYLASNQLFCLECGHPLHPLGTIGAYQLIKVLGQDAISLNQLGWKDGKTFELKTLLPLWLEQPDIVAQFEQEAQALLSLNHPTLPHFVEYFRVNEQPYLVMQPLFGKSLYQVVWDQGPLSLKAAIAVGLQLCEALNYLHNHKPPILHQNLRPENIIRRGSGEPLRITVAGLVPAQQIALHEATTAAYDAPEQQQGQASTASDLYAIGPTLVYLLTGKTPDQFYAQRENGFRFYPEYVPGLDPDLVPILRTLTNPHVGDRYTSAKEVAGVLEAFLVTRA